MTDALTFNQQEFTALSDLAGGQIADAEAGAAALAPLIERGLLTIDGDEVVFSTEMENAFRALGTCRVNVVVMTDAGEPIGQYFAGEASSAARVTVSGDLISFEALSLEEAATSIADGIVSHLATAGASPLPDPGSFAALAALVDMEGLAPEAWAGLAITRAGTDPDAAPEWVLVVRTEPGYVWQYEDRKVLGFAHAEEELAELVGDVLAS